MSQQVIDPVKPPPRISQTLPAPQTRSLKRGIISLLVLIGLLLLLLTGLLIFNMPQVHHAPYRSRTPTPIVDTDDTSPISTPNNKVLPPLQLPVGHYIVYEQRNNLYLVSSTGDDPPELLPTPGYAFSEAVRPILTPSGQLLYSGNGLWLTDIFDGTTTNIANLVQDQIITSMALSDDGTAVAWSTEPIDGNGNIDIYVGSLTAPKLVYEESAGDCPCFRVFSFMNGGGRQGDRTLLLTDDQGSHEGVQYGLWSLDLTTPSAMPQALLAEDPLQGPLALAPYGNTLLYSSNEGVVPDPTDGSVPVEIAPLSFANSLDVATLAGQPLTLSTTQVILPEQHDLSNGANYHWVTTPMFTPDGHTLVYVEFSSDTHAPYDRHSALYTVQVTGAGKQLHVGRPHLLATSTSLLIELGVWLNDHVITFYADGALYALDITSGAVATIVHTAAYARIIAVVGTGQV